MVRNSVSIILILITLLMPVACFAHLCDTGAAAPHASAEAGVEQPDHCPVPHDSDDCDSTCCCAGYRPQPLFADLRYAPVVTTLHPADIVPFLAEILTRIYVPPQNLPAGPVTV